MRRAIDLDKRTITLRGTLRLGEFPCQWSVIKEEPDGCVRLHQHRWVYIGSIFLAVACRCRRDGDGRDCPVPFVTDDVIVTGQFEHGHTLEQEGIRSELIPVKACRVVASKKESLEAHH